MKTFQDIQKLGMHDPVVRSYLNLMYDGMTKEEALIGMVLTLAEQKREITDQHIEHLNRCGTPTVITRNKNNKPTWHIPMNHEILD